MSPPRRRRRIGWKESLALLLALLVTTRWFWMIHQFSVNILFMDHWDVYDVFFQNGSLWDVFMAQLGPHRQGIGFVLTKYVQEWSSWNIRVLCFVIGACVFAAALLAVYLAKRIRGRIVWYDILLFIIVLTPRQYGLFVNTPNLSHGAMPLFLLMLLAINLTASPSCSRGVFSGILVFLLIFSGFGMFAAPIILGTTWIELHAYRRKGYTRALWGAALAMTGITASLLLFAHDYQFLPASPNFTFPAENWVWSYPRFAAGMLANVFGWSQHDPIRFIAASALFLGALFALVLLDALYVLYQAWRSPIDDTVHAGATIRFLLVMFTIIFVAQTTIGRTSMGYQMAFSSRYVTYLLPGLLAICLFLFFRVHDCLQKWGCVALLAIALPNATLRDHDWQSIRWYVNGKRQWKQAYLSTGNWQSANQQADFRIYPWPDRTNLENRLQYLSTHSLNLFAE